MNKVIQGDCLEVMKGIPDKSIDMILCDLPYGTTKNRWDIIIPFDLLWKEYERIIKDSGAIVLTSAQPFTTELIYSNKKLFRYDLIFEKTLGSGFLNAKRMPMRYHEEILIFYKKLPTYNPQKTTGHTNKKGIDRSKTNGTNYGKKTIFNREYDDKGERYPKSILKFSTGNRTKDQFHPTQKPVALFEYLIKTYTNEGDTVLDNCAGSGTTGVACKNLGRNYILIEQEPEYVEIINKRLNPTA